MNRKGSMLDIIVISIIIFASIVVALVAGYITDKFDSALRGISDGSDQILDISHNNVGMWNYLIPLGYVGMLIAFIVMAFQIRSHPIFLIGGIIMLIVAVVLAAQFSNIYDTIGGNSTDIGGYSASRFPLAALIINNLPLLTGIAGVIGLIIMYGKSGEGGVSI